MVFMICLTIADSLFLLLLPNGEQCRLNVVMSMRLDALLTFPDASARTLRARQDSILVGINGQVI